MHRLQFFKIRHPAVARISPKTRDGQRATSEARITEDLRLATCKHRSGWPVLRCGPNDYLIELKRKLVEEAQEALESSTQDDLVQELADLTEVIISLSSASGVPSGAIEAIRLQRRHQRGGFERRLLLNYVDRAEPASG
jgi:predicted house-cleaning noncanonical NTP pyrophosphatase (MazG superfamily)